jgi:hypothetical protein
MHGSAYVRVDWPAPAAWHTDRTACPRCTRRGPCHGQGHGRGHDRGGREQKERDLTELHGDDRDRLCTLLAMLPWQHASDGLFPPNALRHLMLGVEADSAPEPGATRDERWSSLTNVAYEFGRLLSAETQTPPHATFHLAMHVLRAFQPLDAHIAKEIGSLLPVDTVGRLWIGDVTATAWRIMSSELGHQRLAELQHNIRGE